MVEVETAMDLKAHQGRELGHSEWTPIDQSMLDRFAELTGDDHWIHVDPDRATSEMPGGKTIAHGLLVLGMGPGLQRQIYTVRKRGRGLNYGYDKLRFVSPVPVNARVRLSLKLLSAEPHSLGTRITTQQTFEIENKEKPALVAEHILLITNP
ncbi:MaoC family dehydratase [Hoeflea sp. CAU 1731]